MDKQKVPFKVIIDLSLEGMHGVPEGSDPKIIFWNACLGAIRSYSDKHVGLEMQEHKKLKILRDAFESALKEEQQGIIEVEYEAFKWLIKCWAEQKQPFSVNELLERVDDVLQKAKERHEEEFREDGK